MTIQKIFINDSLTLYDFKGKTLGTTVVFAIDGNMVKTDNGDFQITGAKNAGGEECYLYRGSDYPGSPYTATLSPLTLLEKNLISEAQNYYENAHTYATHLGSDGSPEAVAIHEDLIEAIHSCTALCQLADNTGSGLTSRAVTALLAIGSELDTLRRDTIDNE